MSTESEELRLLRATVKQQREDLRQVHDELAKTIEENETLKQELTTIEMQIKRMRHRFLWQLTKPWRVVRMMMR